MSPSHEPAAFLLQIDPDQVGDWYSRAGLDPGPDPLAQLGRALASSAPLEGAGRWALSVRSAPAGLIGAIGYFGEACKPRLEALNWQVRQALERLDYLDGPAVEEACESLADRIRTVLTRSVLRDARFTAIPRGGHIVLGMLAYMLGLDRAQLEPPATDERPLIVVDDCSISGLRFRQVLDRAARGNVVFAHLCSHPDLRAAVEADERVEHCLAARDLHDHGPASMGEEYAIWRERWDQRQPGQHFWLGKLDHVCFPWNEPDIRVWNPLIGGEEPGWRVVPPEHCLKNRVRFAEGGIDLRIRSAPGPILPADDVLDCRLDDQVVVARLGSTAVSLAGAGADMWDLLLEHGTLEGAAAALARRYDAPPEALAADLSTLARQLGDASLVTGLPPAESGQ